MGEATSEEISTETEGQYGERQSESQSEKAATVCLFRSQKKETTLNLQSEISSDGQKDEINQSTTQPESIVVAPADLPVNSIINYDSQALNMLADLALSSAASSTPSCELRNLPCSSELPQNSVLLSKESSLHAASDHEYHRGVKSQKGILLPKLSSDGKNNSESDLTVNQEEENLIPCNEPAKTQSGLPEVAQESSGVNQNSVAVEHSYALLFAEHSKKQLHQRRLPSPVFAKNGIKGPEAGTPIGMVMPFRHLQNTSPLQKLSEDSLTKRKSRNSSSILKDFFYSHTVLNCDGSFRITFKCEAEYAFGLDSKYTNNPLEKTVVRALHGPWDTSLPEDMEEVKLLLHTWVALFYSKKNKVMTSLRKVVEHKNPAKYVCINKALESVDHNEIEEFSSVEKCSVDPLLETNEASKSHAINVSFPGPNCVLPLIKPPPPRDLEFCVQNEQKEVFAGECHLDTSESQNFIFSRNSEVTRGKAKQLSDKVESSNVVLSHIASAQTVGSCISGEDKTFQSLQSTFNDSVIQATLTTSYDRASSESLMCQKSSFSTLDNKVGICHPPVQMQTSSLQDLVQCSTECQPALERTDGNTEYVMINLEPVTFAFGKNAYVPVYTQDTTGKLIGFNTELVKQVSPTMTLQCPASSLEKVQTQRLGDIPSLEISRQSNTKYISGSVEKVTLSKNLYPLQKEVPLQISSPPTDKASVMEALSLVKSSSYSLTTETKYPQNAFPQTQNLLSSEEIMEPLQVKVVSSPTTAALEKKYSLNCIPRSPASDCSLELRDGDKNSLNHEKILESLNSVLSKQTSLSVNGEQDSMELSGGDPDIDLTLTISPLLSLKEDITADEIEQLQKSPVPSLGLQNRAEEMVDPEEEATLIKDREVNSAGYTLAYPVASEEPLKKERKGDDLKPPTLILPKESCTLEISEEVNISNFPFNPLIEEVSPAASPDALLQTEETEPSEAVSQCCLKYNSAQHEKSNKSSKIESGDLAIPEKENSFVGPTHSVGLDKLTQVQERQLSAEIPQILANHPERKGKLTLPDKVTEKIAPSKHDKCFSHSEKVLSHDTELLKPTSPAKYEGNFKFLEKPIKSGNSLQPTCIENRNLDIKHLVLESNDLPSSPRKITENKSSTDMLVSTTTVSEIVNKSMQQKTNPKLNKRNVCDCDLKTGAGSSVHIESLHSDSIDRTIVTQTHLHPEIPKLGSLDSATYTHDTRPVTVEPGFQTQEIPVVRMASLLKDIETELHEKITDLSTVGLQSNSTSTESELIHVLQGTSACEIKTLLNTGIFPTYGLPYQRTVDTSESFIQEPLVSSVPESSDSVAYGVSREHVTSESTSDGITATADSETLGRDGEMNVASDMHYEPLSGDSDQDFPEDCRNPNLNTDNSCSLRGSIASKEDAIKDHYDSSISLNCSGEDTWGYSNEVSEPEVHISPKDWPTGPCHTLIKDECMPCYVQIPDFHGIPRTYANFTVTKEFKDTTRTLHDIKHRRNFTANCGLLSSWTDTWHVADDPTQNTLDLEHLRFEHKLKQILKKGRSQQSASSTTIFSKESPTEVAVGTFPLTKVSKASVVHPSSKSNSPLLVTIVPSHTRLQSSLHRKDCSPSSLNSSSSICKESRNPMNSERNQTAPFHLNKLKYNSILKESRNDISQILNEYAEFNKVMMNSNQIALQDKQMGEVSEDTTFQEACSPVPRRSPSYKDMITDLCATLRIKLKCVVREACRNPFQFYLVETEDKSFFLRTKSILRKGGHTEIEPLHFSQDVHRENTTLVVIIRNEDISSHLHQVPSLLKLKHSASVIFAGIDSPEDVLNDTYQDLFHSGGFVISDNNMIGNLTLAQLKEIVKILEKLNENGRWKWLLHYRENKKLKEDVRVDPVARKKNLILRSYQGVNIIELLPYHDCDSVSLTRTEILKCLINLQIQHISSRFAVFLTSDMPTGSTEVFENSGILVTDVNYFIENMQKIAAPFRSSCW